MRKDRRLTNWSSQGTAAASLHAHSRLGDTVGLLERTPTTHPRLLLREDTPLCVGSGLLLLQPKALLLGGDRALWVIPRFCSVRAHGGGVTGGQG